MPPSREEIRARLMPFLERVAGCAVAIDGLRPLAGGASRAAYALDVTVGEGDDATCRAAVLRLDLGGKIYESALERDEEFRVLALAREGGVPVPEVLWLSTDSSVLGRPFFIMERVEGESIGRRIVKLPDLEAARQALPVQLGEALARIHALDFEKAPFLPRPREALSPAATALERARAELDRVGGAHPVLEAGWRWLRARAPTCPRPVLVHGDFRLGNLIVGREGLRAVLDWEFAAIGDPHEDLAWPFVRDWRFGRDARRFAGISDGEAFLRAYQEAGGASVSRASLRYWEILGNFRWALGCLTQARRHQSGEEPSVELASLGRRAAEMELEMIDLITNAEGE